TFCANLPYTLINEIQERRQTPIPKHIEKASWLLSMQVRAELSPKTLASLSDEQLIFILDTIRLQYSMALIDYGSAVGILAAQAISEPLTQYMLDSHHRSVAGGTNKAGLVRVDEIYKARPEEAEQSPSMQLPLIQTPDMSLAFAQEIANATEFLIMKRFVDRYEILLEPISSLKYPPYLDDEIWISNFYKAHPLIQAPTDLTNWCFRLVLDKMSMVLKGVDLELIVQRLRSHHPGSFIVHTPEGSPEIVIRIWLRSSGFRSSKAGMNEE
ncbi:18838_t:CDS:1, partial [Racocetra persica]